MQTLANYDPYAIQEIEFFVQKKSKYTTLKSILVTLAILALTIYLNINVIEHFWLPRSDLPLVSSSRKMSLEPFSSSYFCVFPANKTIPLPRTTLIIFDIETNQTLKTFTATDKFTANSEVAFIAAGRDSVCYDIQGAVVTNKYYLRMMVHGTIGKDFDYLLKMYSQKELMGDKSQKPNYLSILGKDALGFDKIQYDLQIKKINAIYKDQLLIDYEPERVFGFSPRYAYIANPSPNPSSSIINIFSQMFVPYDLTDQYELSRYNIADILGRILSWFSVFVLICAFIVSPILDFNYKVELAQKLYDNEKLNSIDISLVSYGKYLVSRIKKRLFSEDVLETAFEQLEKDVDLLNLIKRQMLMKKLIKENETLNIPHKEPQSSNINAQLEMDFSQVLLSKELVLDIKSQNRDNQHLAQGEAQPTQGHCPLITQPDQLTSDNILTRFIKSFDISEVKISLISNKGQGYKTSWNTIITVVFLGLLLWFILFAGLFELSPSYKVQTIARLNDETIYPRVTLNPEDVIFRANKSMFVNFDLDAVIIDANDEVIENLTLLDGPDCDSYVIGMNESIGSDWMCLSEPITLQNNGLSLKSKLGLRLIYFGFGFSNTNIQVKLRQYNLVDNEFVSSMIYFDHMYSSSSNYMYGSQSIIRDDPQAQDLEFYWTLNKHTYTMETVFKGLTIELSPEFIRVKKDIPSIWDVINNAWGIVVVAFTVFLSKITRYLNVRKRQNITKNQENQNRNDIVAIISTQYKLIHTVFRDQLKKVKYFYKTKVDDWQMKEN